MMDVMMWCSDAVMHDDERNTKGQQEQEEVDDKKKTILGALRATRPIFSTNSDIYAGL
jgi:hypothetical protein